MSLPRIISFTGRAGSGKDTAAAMLLELLDARYNQHAIRLAFAGPLRACIRLMVAADERHYLTDRTLKEQPIPSLGCSYRELAQTLGDWGRERTPDYWVRILANSVAVWNSHVAVITDVRYPNEAEWIAANEGVLIRIDRPGIGGVREHSSESHVDQLRADFTILNTGTLAELQLAVERTTARIAADQSVSQELES